MKNMLIYLFCTFFGRIEFDQRFGVEFSLQGHEFESILTHNSINFGKKQIQNRRVVGLCSPSPN